MTAMVLLVGAVVTILCGMIGPALIFYLDKRKIEKQFVKDVVQFLKLKQQKQ